MISDWIASASRGELAITDCDGAGWTYGELERQIESMGRSLNRLGIGAADTVAVSLPNGPETAALFVALVSHCRVAPLNPGLTAEETAFALRDLEAAAIITAPEASRASEAAARCGVPRIAISASELIPEAGFARRATARPLSGPDGLALLLHTSGTTAQPKLVPLTQHQLCLSSRRVAATLRLTPGDRCLSMMPLFHIHGLVAGLLASLSAGATVCCAPGFQATRFFSWLGSSKATWYTAVPTMHQAILARARHNREALARHTLRLIRSSSSPLYPTVWEQLESTFGVPALNAYGMTEAAHQIASVPLPGGTEFRGSVGPSSGPEIAIMSSSGELLSAGETGEVVLRGEQIIRGYLHPTGVNEAAFTNGWFRTGDEGVLDGHGRLTLTGRLKEMINCGGEKISPYEVEEALLLHPAIGQAVVFAAPHPMLGEEVAAAVVLREGYEVSESGLLRAAAERLARFKLPRRVLFLDEIPRGATGKVQRIGLAASLGLTQV